VERRAIVTGVNTGIGKATAIALAEHGFDVGMTWFGTEDTARATASRVEAVGVRALLCPLDFSDPHSGVAAIDTLVDDLGGVDVLVNNAGGGVQKSFLELTLDEFDNALRLDLLGAFVCGQTAARRMMESSAGGRIINVTSIQGHVPRTGSTAYCAAKAALSLLTKTMALELGQFGITVNEVAPGEIATSLTDMEGVDPRTVPRPHLPLRRPGSPREVADLIGWLASNESSYVSGACFVVDGGLTLVAPDLATAAD
jgi:NAD(P)-dependent dehydrogenase (short-subunit alcohol dehydrogenase family)